MSLTPLEWMIGIGNTVPLLIGYTLSIMTLKTYFEKKKPLLLLSSILFFTIPSPWLAQVYVFIVAATGNTYDPVVYIYLVAWPIPIIGLVWTYLTASLYQKYPGLKKLLLPIYAVLALIHYWFMYVLKDATMESTGTVYPSVQFPLISELIIYFEVASLLLFIIPSYLYFSRKSEDKLFKIRTLLIAIGAFLFTLVAVVDGVMENTGPILITTKIFMTIALSLIFLGYTPPQSLRDRYQ